jgi:hypothetical protein
VHAVLNAVFPKSDKSFGFGKLLKKKLLNSGNGGGKAGAWGFLPHVGSYGKEGAEEEEENEHVRAAQGGGRGFDWRKDLASMATAVASSPQRRQSRVGLAPPGSSSSSNNSLLPQYAPGSSPRRRAPARSSAAVSFGDALVDLGDEEAGASAHGLPKPPPPPPPACQDADELEWSLGDENAFVREYAADLVEDAALPLGQKLLELAGLRERGDLSPRDFAAAKALLLKVTPAGMPHDGGVQQLLDDSALGLADKLARLAALREARRVAPNDFAAAKATLLRRERAKPRTKELAFLHAVIEDPQLPVTPPHTNARAIARGLRTHTHATAVPYFPRPFLSLCVVPVPRLRPSCRSSRLSKRKGCTRPTSSPKPSGGS